MIIKAPLSWLKDYTDILWPVSDLADRLTMVGLEVDAITEIGPRFEGVVIGHVEAVEAHPDANRLRVCTVDVGDGTLEIVCGAPNVAEGQRVPVARIDAILPGGFKIETTKIRGVVSHGMICSEKELGISDEADGIMVLDSEAPVGQSFADIMGDQDTVLSIDVTTNRPDCLSIVGIAREIAALSRRPLHLPEDRVRESGPPIAGLASVTVEDTEGCPRFVGRVIQDVRIGPSPAWLVRRLEAAGVRTINNVVDVTNYVMLELGQPLHAYDLDLLAGREIIVRRAENGARFTTLDDIERTLTDEMLMIADRDRDIGVAGVMGGLNTEITEETTHVFLEGACFDAIRVRRGAKLLGMTTDASQRFERGVDPDLQAWAVGRAARLIAELAGGTIATGDIDVRQAVQPAPPIRLRIDRVHKLLGISISRREIIEILEALQFSVRSEDDMMVVPPSFRQEVTREADLIEEIARIYGYDRIVPTISSPTPYTLDNMEEADRIDREALRRWREEVNRRLRDTLIGWGCTEVITHSFVHPDRLKLIDPESSPLRLINPISIEYSVMRTTLALSLLEVAQWNINRKVQNIRIFELGRVFVPTSDGDLPDERHLLCVAVTGHQTPAHWGQNAAPVDFFDIKGGMECAIALFALDNVRFGPYDDTEMLYDLDRSASVWTGDQRIGAFGAVAPSVSRRFDLEEPVWLIQLDCDYLYKMTPPERAYKTHPKYPAIERDLALVVPESVEHQAIVDMIRKCSGSLLEDISLFDVYRGEQIAAGKKSLAYALKFRSPERTLTDDEIASIQAKTLARLGELFGAELRA